MSELDMHRAAPHGGGRAISPALLPYRYVWPRDGLSGEGGWRLEPDGLLARDMPERPEAIAADSRWPAFFPCAMCIVTVSDGSAIALEKVVGPSVVNRFPYVIALSFCVKPLSQRHHPRNRFIELLERGGIAAIQFVQPGAVLDRVMGVISETDDADSSARVQRAGLRSRPGSETAAPILEDAYLAYEARLVEPGTDLSGRPIYASHSLDIGSHRLFFLEVLGVHLRADIARGDVQIAWRSLPVWHPRDRVVFERERRRSTRVRPRYEKGYTPYYRFPSAGTVAFAAERELNDRAVMAVKRQSPAELRGLGNDEARWPCFFPSSVGVITVSGDDGADSVMPCGSTTVVSRQPMVFAICVSYAQINERYAPRASLPLLRAARRFVCGVPFLDDAVLDAIRYAGNVSIADDSDKIVNMGLAVRSSPYGAILPDLPVQYLCDIVDEVPLGTHAMLLGEVRKILVRPDVTAANPLEWYPWPAVVSANG